MTGFLANGKTDWRFAAEYLGSREALVKSSEKVFLFAKQRFQSCLLFWKTFLIKSSELFGPNNIP